MKHLIPLLLRSRVFRGLLAAVCVVGVGAGIFRCSLDSLTLSPEQTAEKLLGSADGVLETWQEGQVETGTYPEPPALLATSTVTTVTVEYSGQADLAQNGEAHRFDYTELPLPSAASRGRYDLVSGRWPTRPGECVASGDAVGQWSSTHQQWSVNVVGKFREIYSLSGNRLACAPGTWRERAGKGNSNEPLSASYYLEGPRDEMIRLKTETGAGHETSIMLRTDLLEKQQVSAQRFLGGYSLVFALLVGIPFVFSGMVARWIRGIQQVLVRSGIRPGVMLRAALAALLSGTFVVSAVACALGMLATLALRPLLQQANSGLPLGPWEFSLAWLVQVALLTAGGALLGFLALNASQRVRARLAERAPRPLSATMSGALGWAALGLWGFAIWSLVTSAGKLWPMSLGVIFTVLGTVALAPGMVARVSGALGRKVASPKDLAARLLREDGARWAGVSGVATLLIGLVLSVFINISASMSAQILLLAPQLPPGTVLLQITDPAGERIPEDVIAQFERDNAVRPAAILHDTSYGIDGEGAVQVFDSVEEATAVLGLTPEQASVLASGGLLKLGGADEDVVLTDFTDPSRTIRVRVVGFKPSPERRLNTGYAFGLKSTVPVAEGRAGVYRVYVGMTLEQEAGMGQWPVASGHGDVLVNVHRPATGADAPLWLTIGFTGVALLAIPLLVWTLQREVQALRPLARNLTAMGMPESWARRVLSGVIGPVLAVPLGLGLIAGLVSTALLHWLYPTVFDLAGVNFLGLVLFTASLLLAGALAVRLGVRQLHTTKRALVI